MRRRDGPAFMWCLGRWAWSQYKKQHRNGCIDLVLKKDSVLLKHHRDVITIGINYLCQCLKGNYFTLLYNVFSLICLSYEISLFNSSSSIYLLFFKALQSHCNASYITLCECKRSLRLNINIRNRIFFFLKECFLLWLLLRLSLQISVLLKKKQTKQTNKQKTWIWCGSNWF